MKYLGQVSRSSSMQKKALTCDIKSDMYKLIFVVSLPRDRPVEEEVLAN